MPSKKCYIKRFPEQKNIYINDGDLNIIKKWLITGSFNKSINLNNDFDKSKKPLLIKWCNHEPKKIEKIMKETYNISFNKSTYIYLLVMLSLNSFKSKKTFKDNFDKYIIDSNDLFQFLFYLKKERGIGSLIKNTIINWIKHHDVYELENLFINCQSKHSWTFSDVLKTIKPKPRDYKENLLFQWGLKKNNNIEDYKDIYNKIYNYEKMKKGLLKEKEIIELIKENKVSNKNIPSNVQRTPELYSNLLMKMNVDNILIHLPRYLNEMKFTRIHLDNIKNELNNLTLNKYQLLEIINSLIDGDKNIIELKEILLKILENKIRNEKDSAIHIIDNNIKLNDLTLKKSKVKASIMCSVLTGSSNNVYSLRGDKLSNKFEDLITGKNFYETNKHMEINKIFDQIRDKEFKTVFIWLSGCENNKREISSKIQNFKLNTYKKFKVCFISLDCQSNIKKTYNYEVIGITKKTERFLSFFANNHF